MSKINVLCSGKRVLKEYIATALSLPLATRIVVADDEDNDQTEQNVKSDL